MGPFVVLAVTLALVATGVTVVTAWHLGRRAKRLAEAVNTANARLTPLLEELQAEAAVTSLETEQLQRRQTRGGA